MTDPTTSLRDPCDPLPEELEAAARAESLREAWPRLADLPDFRVRIIGGWLARIGRAAEVIVYRCARPWMREAAAGEAAVGHGRIRIRALNRPPLLWSYRHTGGRV